MPGDGILFIQTLLQLLLFIYLIGFYSFHPELLLCSQYFLDAGRKERIFIQERHNLHCIAVFSDAVSIDT